MKYNRSDLYAPKIKKKSLPQDLQQKKKLEIMDLALIAMFVIVVIIFLFFGS